MKRVHLLQLSLMLLITFGFVGCPRRETPSRSTSTTSKQPPVAPSKVTVTIGTFTKSLAHAPLYAALHFKWFEQEPALRGITIVYKDYNDRPTISQAFGDGTLDVLFSAEVPQILCRAQGDDIRAVMLTTWARQEILVQNSISARSFKDLRGRSIAVLAGTSSHYAVLKLLETNNMRTSEVTLKFMSPPEARTAFEGKRIDAWAVWPPFIEQQTVAGRGKVLPGGDHIISILMAYRRDLLTKPSKQQAAAGIASVLLRAKAWTVAHPAEAQAITARTVGLPLNVVQAAWPKQHWDATLTEDKIDDLQRKATFLAEAGLTRDNKKVEVRTDLVDLSILKGAGK